MGRSVKLSSDPIFTRWLYKERIPPLSYLSAIHVGQQLDRLHAVSCLTNETINDFYARLKYYTPEAPTVKKELHPDFVVEKGMQENLIHCILHARRLLTLEEGLRWQDIKRYGIIIYRRYYEGYTLVNITDKMDTNDPRRAIQLPASVITAGMQPNPRND